MDAPASFAFQAAYERGQPEDEPDRSKGPSKRKRLAKACTACHKSKRRCDGKSPCSNCSFANKSCAYIGRAVAAPGSAPAPDASIASKPLRGAGSRPKAHTEDEELNRKRVQSSEFDNINAAPPPFVLDHALTRELTNLFFAHAHPVRAVFHKPTFSALLAQSRVPSYLLLAICAIAAPSSRQPRFRASGAPPRLSGRQFASEAEAQMFDASGHLVCDASLFTAQALCLLMVHDLAVKDASAPPNARYRDLALQILRAMGVFNSEPTANVVLTPESIHASVECECARRIFWVMHVFELAGSVYSQRSVSLSENQLRLRLPVDETSFELAVHYPAPEYLHPSARAQSISELGCTIRILSLYAQTEQLLARPDATLNDFAQLEQRAEDWVASLSDNLRFSEENLAVQQSMFETSSNMGAWCFCCMHVSYVGFVLALAAGRSMILQSSPSPRPQYTTKRLDSIMQMLGDRLKNSVLLGTIIWIQMKYCNRDDARIRSLCSEYAELWGTRIADLVVPLAIPRATASATYAHSAPRLIPPSTSSQIPLGRSLDELRLHNQSNWSSPSTFASLDREELLKNNVDADLPPRSGHLGESLPSLKSSGLLDFSSTPRPSSSHHAPVGLQWLAHEPR